MTELNVFPDGFPACSTQSEAEMAKNLEDDLFVDVDPMNYEV